jgi:hypothetical protein
MKLFDVFIIHCNTDDLNNITDVISEIKNISEEKMIIIIKHTEDKKNKNKSSLKANDRNKLYSEIEIINYPFMSDNHKKTFAKNIQDKI